MEYSKIDSNAFYAKLCNHEISTIEGFEIEGLKKPNEFYKNITSSSKVKIIKNCKFINPGSFSNLTTTCDVQIYKCIFESEEDHVLYFHNLKSLYNQGSIYFGSTNEFNIPVSFSEIEMDTFNIGGKFMKDIRIHDCKKNISLNGAKNSLSTFHRIKLFQNELDIFSTKGIVIENGISFHQNVPNSIILNHGNYGRIYFNDITDIKKLGTWPFRTVILKIIH